MSGKTTKNPFLIISLFLVVFIFMISMTTVFFSGNIEHYGNVKNTIGEDDVTYVSLSENETVNITDFITVELLELSPNDKEIKLRISDDISDEEVIIALNIDETYNIKFDDYELDVVEVIDLEDDITRVRIDHPSDADYNVLFDYLTEIIISGFFVFVALIFIVIVGDMR